MENETLVSFLGTGNYGETCYRFPDGGEFTTRFVALALAELLDAQRTVVLATKQARAIHGEALQAAFAEQGRALRIEPIAVGRSDAELWAQFEALRAAMDRGDSGGVAVDITHGFRAQPFFAAAAIALLRFVRGPDLPVAVYYGEYRKEEGVSPLWNLSLFVERGDMQTWRR